MTTYFAYGSNMEEAVIRERCPESKFLERANLPEYRLGFTRRSMQVRKCGVADVISEPGSLVWGVLYSLTPKDVRLLDRFEGVHRSSYQQVRVEVRLEGETHQSAMTYEVVTKEPEEIPPSAAYMDGILTGARERGLPAEYVKQLEQMKTGFGL